MKTSYASIAESELILIIKNDFLLKVVNKRTVSKDYVIGEEFRSQYGIPDLLFYNFNNKVLDYRWEKKMEPVLSKDIIKTLLLIQDKKKITLSFLQDNLPLNKDVIKNKVIRYLLKNNYINKSATDLESFWVGDNTYESCMDNMFAIEAKISNWKRGFYQAYRYKWFSNYSFLALHQKFVNPALENLPIFIKHNVGLMSVDTNKNKVKLLYRPRKERPYSGEIAALTFEKLFATYCEKKATSQSAQSSFLII